MQLFAHELGLTRTNRLKMKNYLLVASVLMVSVSWSQDSVSALFIGNSYTAYNNLPNLVSSLATSLGDELFYDSNTPGGYTFELHAGNPTTYLKINSQPWDHVILQAQSQEPSFPDNQVNTNTLPYAIQMADSVYANRFCSEVTFFMTWGRENGDPQWGPISTFDGMNQRLYNAYMRFKDSVQGSVAPVAAVWKYVRDNYPSIDLYSDGSHPSAEGSYLAACTFYTSLFRKPVSATDFYFTVDTVTADILQAAADLVVLDSLDHWNLRPLSEHTQAAFTTQLNGSTVTCTNESTKADQYTWNFGDGNSSQVEHPSHAYSGPGTYIINLIAGSPCDTDTATIEITIPGLSVEESGLNFKLHSDGNGRYRLTFDGELTLELVDEKGRVIRQPEVYTSLARIDLSSEATGVYLMKLEGEQSSTIVRVIR